MVKVKNLEEPRIRHGSFIPHSQDKKTLFQNLEQVRKSKPIITPQIKALRKKINNRGQISIDIDISHAAELLNSIHKLSGDVGSKAKHNTVTSFENFGIIERKIKSNSKDPSLLKVINSHQRSLEGKHPDMIKEMQI